MDGSLPPGREAVEKTIAAVVMDAVWKEATRDRSGLGPGRLRAATPATVHERHFHGDLSFGEFKEEFWRQETGRRQATEIETQG